MNVPENIYLVGPMGAGKSTVGRHLARLLHKDFVDADAEIEGRTGASISLIFELEGEEGFRRRERSMLDELTTSRTNVVLATGGGAVLEDENRARLRTHGFVVYLSAPLELLARRTSRDRTRPLLETEEPADRLAALLEERDPLYRQVADMIARSDRRSPRHTAREIARRIEDL